MAFPPTDWGDFTPDEYEVGAPATSYSFERWFRNVVAMAQGATGAPRVRIGSLQRLDAGSSIRSRNDDEISVVANTSGTARASQLSFGFMQAGSVRVFREYRSTATTHNPRSIVRLTRNGIVTDVSSEVATTSWQSREVDVPVMPGDLLTVLIEAYPHSSSVYTAYGRNARIMTDGQDLYPGSSARIEGNTYA